MLKLIFFLALSVNAFQYSTAVCNVCHEVNGVACKSETEFHPCFNGKPDITQTYACLEPGQICTSTAPICVFKADNPQIKPACGDTSQCGNCAELDNGKYTCTSRTTYTMCFDGGLSNIRATCPDKQICDIAKANAGEYPCVLSCKEPGIEICDLDQPIDVPITTTQTPTVTIITTITTTDEVPLPTTTTTESQPIITTTTEDISTTTVFSPTPPATTDNPSNLVCSQQTATGRYPHPNDKTCKSYIYCYRKEGQMQTAVMKCPDELYFNPATTLCDRIKPAGCI